METIEIRELRQRAVQMMLDMKTILEKNNVEYWIEYGTMLGAVRSGKMVPWDNEIDIGVFDDSFTNREKVLGDLAEKGYKVKYKPDRIKIFKTGWQVGSFNYDLHLYHIDKDEAYVSAAIPQPPLLNKLFDRFYWVVSLYDCTEEITYHFDKMMKLLATRFDLTDENSVPKEITFKKGPYNSELSYEISGRDFCLKSSPINENITGSTQFAVELFGKIPSRLIHFLKRFLDKIRPATRYSPSQQRIPVHFYTNLSKITLCGIPFKGPKEKEQYLELVYGPTWRVPNNKWQRKDINIIK